MAKENVVDRKPVRDKLYDNFDIERVINENNNLSNPLFPIVGRLVRLLEMSDSDKYQILSLTNRFFSYFNRKDDVSDAIHDYLELFMSDYDCFKSEVMLLVSMIINKYSEYYN